MVLADSFTMATDDIDLPAGSDCHHPFTAKASPQQISYSD
jgi:hypothetical protein